MPPEAAEPSAGNLPVPVWLMVLLFVLLYAGMVFFDRFSGWFNAEVYMPYASLSDLQAFQPRGGGGPSPEHVRAVYENNCGLCHSNDGKGKPGQAPPYVGSEWVLGSPERMIRIPLSGLSGPVQVEGTEWNLSMPSMGAALSDDDLAAVLTYIRTSWGNKASAISPEQVKAVRAQIGARSQPWTAEQLKAVP
jgi:mono/diheme cytochrome c family protein